MRKSHRGDREEEQRKRARLQRHRRATLSVTKQERVQDQWRHYHNVRATYRMTRRVPRAQTAADLADPRCFLCGCMPPRISGAPNCKTCRHAVARIYPRGGPALSRNSPLRWISDAKRDIRKCHFFFSRASRREHLGYDCKQHGFQRHGFVL